MRKIFSLVAAAFVAMAMIASPAYAGTTIYNTAPNDPWSYGSGNDYTPANTAVMTLDDGRQMYLRAHKRQVVAPASDASGVYSFALDPGGKYNIDWGFDTNNPDPMSGFTFGDVSLVLTNLGTGATAVMEVPYSFDEPFVGGSVQNSFQLGWLTASDPNFGIFGDIGFDPGVDSTFRIDMLGIGLNEGQYENELTIFAKFGDGFQPTAAVPEPTTWALMILGFGMVGGVMRTNKRSRSQLAAA